MMHKREALRGLYVITDTALIPDEQFAERVEAALRGGARIVQYRDKRDGLILTDSPGAKRGAPQGEPKEALKNSALPVGGRRPQREQGHKPLIRGDHRGHVPRRGELKKSMDGFFQHFPEGRPGMVGLRERLAGEVVRLCRAYGALSIVNDDVELAARVGADGVHIGKEDAALAYARNRLGQGAVIGVSCYNRLDLALEAAAQGADYVAFGSFFPSRVKPEAVPASLDLLREARQTLSLPLCAIGGITADNAAPLVEAGADMLAVISDVFAAAEIEAAARRYAPLFEARRPR